MRKDGRQAKNRIFPLIRVSDSSNSKGPIGGKFSKCPLCGETVLVNTDGSGNVHDYDTTGKELHSRVCPGLLVAPKDDERAIQNRVAIGGDLIRFRKSRT